MNEFIYDFYSAQFANEVVLEAIFFSSPSSFSLFIFFFYFVPIIFSLFNTFCYFLIFIFHFTISTPSNHHTLLYHFYTTTPNHDIPSQHHNTLPQHTITPHYHTNTTHHHTTSQHTTPPHHTTTQHPLQTDIEQGLKTLKTCSQVCERHRRRSTFMQSLKNKNLHYSHLSPS